MYFIHSRAVVDEELFKLHSQRVVEINVSFTSIPGFCKVCFNYVMDLFFFNKLLTIINQRIHFSVE